MFFTGRLEDSTTPPISGPLIEPILAIEPAQPEPLARTLEG